jgi:hypothetical protein
VLTCFRKINDLVEELDQLRSVVGEQNAGVRPHSTVQSSHLGPQHESPDSHTSPASNLSNRQRSNDGFHTQRERTSSSAAPVLQTWQSADSIPRSSIGDRSVSFTTSTTRRLGHVELTGAQVDDLFRTSVYQSYYLEISY